MSADQYGWTDEARALLKTEWLAGLSASQIVARLYQECRVKKSRNAVIGVVHRMGLAGRATPSRPAPQKRIQQKRRVERTKQEAKKAAAPKVFAPRASDLKPSTVDGKPMSIIDLQPHQCKWPIGDPQEEGFGFCGRPTGDHECVAVYCAEHRALAYQPTHPRRSHQRAA